MKIRGIPVPLKTLVKEAIKIAFSSKLFKAVYFNNLEKLKVLVEKGGNIESKSKDGSTLLSIASLQGNLDIVKYLVEKGANIEGKNDKGQTPLLIAAICQHMDVVKYLVEQGANIECKDDEGRTPLLFATICQHMDVVKYLVEQGANIESKDDKGQTPLSFTTICRNIDILKYLVEKGANIECKDNDGKTPLYSASLYGNFNVVKYLVEHGANIDSSSLAIAKFLKRHNIVNYFEKEINNNKNESTVEYSSTIVNDYTESILTTVENESNANSFFICNEYFVEWGTNIESKDKDGYTPLIRSSICGNLGIVKWLVKQGANIEGKDDEGQTPLLLASICGNIDVVKWLVKQGANIESEDNNGLTPLFSASYYGYLDIVKYLVEHGANIESTSLAAAKQNEHFDIVHYLEKEINNNKNESTVEYSSTIVNDYTESILTTVENESNANSFFICNEYFVEWGTNIESKDKDGYTPLIRSSICGNLGIVKWLVKQGANIEGKDDEGQTPLLLASICGNIDVVKWLVKQGANIESEDNNGLTPLFSASYYGYLDIVKYLVEHGANIESTSLAAAKQNEHFDIVHYLEKEINNYKNKSNVEYTSTIINDHTKNILTTVENENNTNSSFECNEYFVEKEVIIESKDKDGYTPLIHASICGNLDIVKCLVEQGANIEGKNDEGQTPLLLASICGNIDVVKWLVKQGANIESEDNNGLTPLFSASYYGYLDIVKYLVEHGANIESTSLAAAKQNEHFDIINYLLKEIKEKDRIKYDNETLLTYECKQGNIKE